MPDLFAQPALLEDETREIVSRAESVFELLKLLEMPARVHAINRIRQALHALSPFSSEPVDCVLWIQSADVTANDYNPNSVAPPEMKLLEHSVTEDGYTQPIVAWRQETHYEVVDGFHRHRVGKESAQVSARVRGYLPVVAINAARADKGDRIAATIRHNRARGKHRVDAMSDIVVELKRRNWSDEKIGRELGMDADEVLRLCQITGLAEVFANQDFSVAWEIGDTSGAGDEVLSDLAEETPDYGARVFHTWEKWECQRAGFYDEKPEGMTQDEGEEAYRAFLSDQAQFEAALQGVTTEWPNSCEHYLTNDRMNRIAWLGQASMAYAKRVPSCCRGGYNRLTDSQKEAADLLALQYLNIWLVAHGRSEISREDALPRTETELY